MAQCPKCGKSFINENAINQHLQYKHNIIVRVKKIIPCHVCGRKFKYHDCLSQHEASDYHERHGKKVSWFSSVKSSNFQSEIESDPKDFINRTQTTEELNRSIDQELQPDEVWHTSCRKDMDYLATYLKESTKLDVAETIKGGSLSKGTALKGNADLDVVVFLNGFKSMVDFRQRIDSTVKTLLYNVEQWAENNNNVQVQGTTLHAVKCKIRHSRSSQFIDVDILPAMNIVKTRAEREQVYQQLNSMGSHKREYFSSALVELQRDFVKEQQPNVKNIIRLLKHWRDVYFDGCSSKPSSYLLELLTIHSWERARSPGRFDTKKAFKSTLGMLKDYEDINAKWQENYNTSDYSKAAIKGPRSPFILDPANPFNNVCNRVRGWKGISEKARLTMAGPLLRDVLLPMPYHSWN